MEDSETRGKVRGPSPLMRQRQEYARLVARGVSNAEACRAVGVNRRTGHGGGTGAASLPRTEPSGSIRP